MRRTITVAVVAAVVGALVATPIAVYASHSFNDVPDSNTFHEDIAWLADAGVTKGCNPPDNTEYCPKDNVTREQMAAFMRRLAENQVVDAGTVQGQTANELVPLVETSYVRIGLDTEALESETEILTVTVDAPTSGQILVTGFATVGIQHPDVGGSIVAIDITDDYAGWDPYQEPGAHITIPGQAPGGPYTLTVTPHRAFSVAEGEYTYSLAASPVESEFPGASINHVTLTAVFYPNP
jgi:hypothetical protein